MRHGLLLLVRPRFSPSPLGSRTSWLVLLLVITSAGHAQQRFMSAQSIDTTRADPHAVETTDVDGDGDVDVLSVATYRNDLAWSVNHPIGAGDHTEAGLPQPAGRHEAVFEAETLPSGLYLYRLEAGPFARTRTMLLVK